MTEPTERDREAAEAALWAWGNWQGFKGSVGLRDAVSSAIAAAREGGRREERRAWNEWHLKEFGSYMVSPNAGQHLRPFLHQGDTGSINFGQEVENK